MCGGGMLLKKIILLGLLYHLGGSTSHSQTDLVKTVPNDRLLLFILLDGTLVALDEQTWKIRWEIRDKPIVEVPHDTSDAIFPICLPDPRDGSLYLVGNQKEPLRKLPFTVQQLVAASPCKSSDGILYTGKKEDSWMRLDPYKGDILEMVGWDTDYRTTCPRPTSHSIQIGRTKYSLMMTDDQDHQKRWNITYYDYTTHSFSGTKHLPPYQHEYTFLTSSSTGRYLILDHRWGTLLHDDDVGSTIVGIYTLDMNGLAMVPFTSLANTTLANFAMKLSENRLESENDLNLYSTVYIGDHLYGWYALPSLIDDDIIGIASLSSLETTVNPEKFVGNLPDQHQKPTKCSLPLLYRNTRDIGTMYTDPLVIRTDYDEFLIRKNFIGHYYVSGRKFGKNNLLTGRQIHNLLLTDESNNRINPQHVVEQIENETRLKSFIKQMKDWMQKQENKGVIVLMIILSGLMISMLWYVKMQVREIRESSRTFATHNNTTNNNTINSSSNNSGGDDAVRLEELPDGQMRIGKITFYPGQVLGKGCEGTVVYRGQFDTRSVAIKRILPEYLTYADREVALLRESDTHPNVIRYYCMEEDRLFRYIALEICQGTLLDYVQGNFPDIQPLQVLQQATRGLAHLHSLDIVHRDIKPQNVLLSVGGDKTRVMISDFGMCRKLTTGKMSFSRRSGITGTDGWIAPEMYNSHERTTNAVDLFSLGCLYYYVLSKGRHPFGDVLRRQMNISNGYWSLNDLHTDDNTIDELWTIFMQKILIAALIQHSPDKRPNCEAVLRNPIFWDIGRILAFFQDVSDRVELADYGDHVRIALELNCSVIVKTNWRLHIDDEVANDIKKYRTYNGQSVRDLLRALRNKKHHFRELTETARSRLGEIPEAFTKYWLRRFPLLFAHAWITMQCCAREGTFQQYYDSIYRFEVQRFDEQLHDFQLNHPYEIDTDKLELIQSQYQLECNGGVTRTTLKSSYSRTNNNSNVGGSPNHRNKYIPLLWRRMNEIRDETTMMTTPNNNGPSSDDFKLVMTNRRKKKTTTTGGGSKSDEPMVWAINSNLRK